MAYVGWTDQGRPTPPEAAALWETLEAQYKRAQYYRKNWIMPVLRRLCVIIRHLMRDLELARSMYKTFATWQHRR